MARFLRQHPEFELSDNLYEQPTLPEVLKLAPAMALKSYVDTRNTALETPLIKLVHSLRKQSVAQEIKERDSAEVEIAPIERVLYQSDFFDLQAEALFEQVITSDEPISALAFWHYSQIEWQESTHCIDPKAWIELVFSNYCKLTNEQQTAFSINMKGIQVYGTTANFSYHDVVIGLKAS